MKKKHHEVSAGENLFKLFKSSLMIKICLSYQKIS